MNMKYSKNPIKPYAPYKPQPPSLQIEKKIPLGTLSAQEDNEFSLQSFEELIKSRTSSVNLADVKFTWEIEKAYGYYDDVKEYGYYDDVTVSLNLKIYTVSMVDNPNYQKLLNHYNEQLKKYEEDLKQYKIDEKKYKEELEQYTLEHAKVTVKRLESKVKK